MTHTLLVLQPYLRAFQYINNIFSIFYTDQGLGEGLNTVYSVQCTVYIQGE